ncbi:MAG: hypothetical protein ACI9J3_002534 [Parvicellaceae bacterium]|jgi:hypothetical protein
MKLKISGINHFYLRFGLFVTPFIIVLIIVVINNSELTAEANSTESNLVITPKNNKFDFVFLGTSQVRTLTREKNNLITDSIFGANKYLNLAQGSGGGGFPAVYSLEYFYNRGNIQYSPSLGQDKSNY